MKIQTGLFIFAIILSSCATQKKAITGTGSSTPTAVNSATQDGSSYENAILVKSIPEEYEWLRQHYPGHKVTMQALAYSKKVPYDILSIVLQDGTKKDVYFDIHKFFGKF